MAKKKNIRMRKTKAIPVAKVDVTPEGGLIIEVPPEKAEHLRQRLEKVHGKKVQRA